MGETAPACDFRCLACRTDLHACELQAVAAASTRAVRDLEGRIDGLGVRLDEVRRAQAKAEQRLRAANDERESAERRLERAERRLERAHAR
jgi:chromosome segregation ATPase